MVVVVVVVVIVMDQRSLRVFYLLRNARSPDVGGSDSAEEDLLGCVYLCMCLVEYLLICVCVYVFV